MSQCGFDPQNLLQVDADLLLHTRWLRLCSGGVQGDLNTPVVQSRSTGLMQAVIGDSAEVVVTAGGEPLDDEVRGTLAEIEISTPVAKFSIEKAHITRDGRRLLVTPIQ